MNTSSRSIALPSTAAVIILLAAGAGCGSDATAPLTAQIAAISAGLLHTCAVTTDDNAFCWGWNRDGQLGDGSNSDRSAPVRVRSGDVTFDEVSAGGGHTCAIGTDGFAYCWGFNFNGQLGDGSNTTRTAVARISGATQLTNLSMGASYSCGLTATGEAYCWGWNARGQLGDGSQTDRTTAVQVMGGLSFTSVSAGTFHTCGVTPVGEAYCWGQNDVGQLGDGTTTDTSVPVLVTGTNVFQSVTVGFSHSCGLTDAGAAVCWGAAGAGQLGNGSIVDRTQPGPVTGAITFAALSTRGGNFTCGVATTGEGYCWGLNNGGQLGAQSPNLCSDPDNGLQAACAIDPLAVSGGLRFRSISAATQHTCGVATDNIAYCWGLGNRGQLGNGTASNSVVVEPVRVLGQS